MAFAPSLGIHSNSSTFWTVLTVVNIIRRTSGDEGDNEGGGGRAEGGEGDQEGVMRGEGAGGRGESGRGDEGVWGG